MPTDEVRLRAALDCAELGYFERVDYPATYLLDDRMRAMLGIPPEEAHRAQEFWIEHIHPDDREAVLEQGQAMVAGQNRVSAEYRYLHPDGRQLWFWHLASVIARDESAGRVREVGVIQDITDRKRREDELRQALEQVQRLRDQLHQENVYLRHEARTAMARDATSVAAPQSSARSTWPTRSRRCVRQCCCPAKPAPGRSGSRSTFTKSVHVAIARWSV